MGAIEKNFWKIFVGVVIFKIILLYFFTIFNFLSWDKTIWHNAIKTMYDTGIVPFVNSDQFVLGVTEYPISWVYFLILFIPVIKFLSYKMFIFIFGFIQICFDIGIGILLTKLIKDKKRILFCFLIAPTVLVLSSSRFDLMPAFLILLSIYLINKKRDKLSTIFLTLGSFLKIYPVMLIPSLFGKLKIKRFFYYLFYFLVFVFIINIPLLFNIKGLLLPISDAGSYRPESWVGLLGLLGVIVKNAEIINYVLLAGLLVFGFFRSKTVLGKLIALMIPLLITNKIFSPQWNLWFLPLLALTNIRISMIVLFDLITIIEFPFVWGMVAGITQGFDSALFTLSNPFSLIFFLLIVLRYGFFIYFYVKSVNDGNLVNKKVVKGFKKLLSQY